MLFSTLVVETGLKGLISSTSANCNKKSLISPKSPQQKFNKITISGFVTQRNLAVTGDTISRGTSTKDCLDQLKSYHYQSETLLTFTPLTRPCLKRCLISKSKNFNLRLTIVFFCIEKSYSFFYLF